MSFDVDILFKIAGIGIAIALLNQILSKAGRDEQATLVSITGIVIVLIMLVGEIGTLFETLREVFGI